MEDKYTLGINFYTLIRLLVSLKMENLLQLQRKRFSRVKHTSNFPVKSINFCLKEAEIDISNWI